jgi:hypothetical protein
MSDDNPYNRTTTEELVIGTARPRFYTERQIFWLTARLVDRATEVSAKSLARIWRAPTSFVGKKG